MRICDFFEEINIIVELNSNILFIIQCYILTKYAVRDENEIPVAINYSKIRDEYKISNTQTKLLIHKYQKQIADQSCFLVLSLAKQILNKESALLKVVPFFQQIAEEQRNVVPCYYSTKIIFLHALEVQKPILLTSKRYNQEGYLDTIHLLFVPSSSKQFVYDEKFLASYKGVSCVVIRGEVRYNDTDGVESKEEYKNRLLELGLLKIVLYNMAKHPQYTGTRLNWLAENPFDLFKKDFTFFFSAPS